jgi:integrase
MSSTEQPPSDKATKATKRRRGNLVKRGPNYYVRWMVDGKIFSKALKDEHGQSITNKDEAETARNVFMEPFAQSKEAEMLKGISARIEVKEAAVAAWEDSQNPPLSITQAWTAFLDSPNRPDSGDGTLYHYECQWRQFAEWMQKKHPDLLTLRDVTANIAEEYAGHLKHEQLSANTYNKHVRLLEMVFRVLKLKAKMTEENPWASPKRGGSLTRKTPTTHSRRELTLDELKRVCKGAEGKGELEVLLALGIFSGMRLGDCATLLWGETDLGQKLIRRVPNKTARKHPDRTVIIPIHKSLHLILSRTPVEKRLGYVLPEMAALYQHQSDSVTDLVQAHLKACGIQVHKDGTGPEAKGGKRAVILAGFHSLRHSFVSLCRASDVPLSVVESIVGHSSPAMTRYYTHTGDEAAKQAIAALPDFTGDTPTPDKPAKVGDALGKIRSLLKGMTAETWEEKAAWALKLLSGLEEKAPKPEALTIPAS